MPPHVCEWQEHASVSKYLLPDEGSYLWKLSGLQNLINRCIKLDVFHCAVGSHWRKTIRLLFGGESDRACFTCYPPTFFRCHGKHVFLWFPRESQTSALAGQVDTASCEMSTTALSLHCRSLDESMTHQRLVLNLRCELRFRAKTSEDRHRVLCLLHGGRPHLTRHWNHSSARKKGSTEHYISI